MPPTPTFRLACLAVLFAAGAGEAGEAVFSQDGSRVYLIDPGEVPDRLRVLDLAAGRSREVTVPGAGGEPVIQVDRSNAGYLLCLTESACLAWDVAKGSSVRVCGAPEGGRFVELAYDRSSGLIAWVVRFEEADGSGLWELWVQPKGADAPARTAVRRVRAIEGIAFDDEGNLFFGADGDLWLGRLREIGPGPDEKPGGSLSAFRFAPLATRETANATPSQIGVSTVGVAGPWLYVHVARMGGSGWGTVVRLAKPEAPRDAGGEPEMPLGLLERLAVYQAALRSVVDLGENGSLAYLAATADGRLVHFKASRMGGESRHWLVRDHGEPEPLPFTVP